MSAISMTVPSSSAIRILTVLANALPRMISAMTSGGNPPLGGITAEVAKLLNAEICSIWLLDDTGKNLILREAEGYKDEAVGLPHSKEGLTGRILNENVQFVLNFGVQDRELGWRGLFDKQLKTHCWSMLGVPIISSRPEHKALGVLKLENRRRPWGTSIVGSYLQSVSQRVCTPQSLRNQIHNLSRIVCRLAARRKAHEIASRTRALESLTQELQETTQKIRFICKAFLDLSPESDSKLVGDSGVSGETARQTQTVSQQAMLGTKEEYIYEVSLQAGIEAMRWHLGAIRDELLRLRELAPKSRNDVENVFSTAEALNQACLTYDPFTLEDLLLARTISAMIAATLDIQHAGYAIGWERIRHSLDNVPSNFLSHIDRTATLLTKELAKPSGSLLQSLAISFRSALVVDGTKELFRQSEVESERFADQITAEEIEREVQSRAGFYERLGKLNGYSVRFKSELSAKDKKIVVRCIYPHFRGALDVIVDNALKFGKPPVHLRLFRRDSELVLAVKNHGTLPEDFRIGRGRKFGDDKSGTGLGLFSARRALNALGGDLCFRKSRNTTTFSLILKAEKPSKRKSN